MEDSAILGLFCANMTDVRANNALDPAIIIEVRANNAPDLAIIIDVGAITLDLTYHTFD